MVIDDKWGYSMTILWQMLENEKRTLVFLLAFAKVPGVFDLLLALYNLYQYV